MLKIIIFLFTCLVLFGAIFYFLGTSAGEYDSIWSRLEQDLIYLEDGKVLKGWIWEERVNMIIGERLDKTIFSLPASDYKAVKRDYLRQAG